MSRHGEPHEHGKHGASGELGETSRYVFSYEPLGEPEPEPGTGPADTTERDRRDAEVGAFLNHVAELGFEAGPKGLELRSVDVAARTCAFRQEREVDPRPPVRAPGEEPGGAVLLGSPSWAHLAHLVGELPFLFSFREYGPEGGPELCGVDAPTREWADVLVEHRGEQWRVRVALEGRERPVEFPGMEIGELFGEGDFRRFLLPGTTDVLDAGV
ncbi:hypothetical protein [Streptomyces sp. MA5143a]|uniref:hypothetical protein n=1 Tax=Streptomyces sp. MA5143a TaxID=2083010 RepID=UPI000D19C055|nr:hypothetical protein [Streptomyces sp. MA5143a]SPF05344.1 hypothetical protein SMA5143A_6155 [Streptomyces sp. MA5143a]